MQLVVAEFLRTPSDCLHHQAGDLLLTQVQWPVARHIQIAVHPDKGLAAGELVGWRIASLGKATVEMKRHEQGLVRRVLVRQASAVEMHL
jgi:hypothetical protein